jgi:hypothetical protein
MAAKVLGVGNPSCNEGGAAAGVDERLGPFW